MEIQRIGPAKVGGVIKAPASKSAMQRAIACATLARGVSRISGAPVCADSRAALRIAEGLGAAVKERDGLIEIEGSPFFGEKTGSIGQGTLAVSCGESGLCMRMFSPIVALLDVEVSLEGEGSLARRPMGMVEDALSAFGASCASRGGLPPLRIRGPLQAKRAKLDAKGSSQLLTGLLTALPLLHEDSEIEVENLVSSGYLDMTMEMCARFGVRVERGRGGSSFFISGGQFYRATELSVEGDWSGAAFLLVAAAIAGGERGLCIRGLYQDSRQPDMAIVEVLRRSGAVLSFEGTDLTVLPGTLHPFYFNANDCPDICPPLVALAAAIRGESRIEGVHRLASKESDRAAALKSTFGKLGVEVTIEGDTMRVKGGNLHGGSVASWGDHRIAMAAAIAALAAKDEVIIEGAECVAKSWPDFFGDLSSIIQA